MTEFTLSATVDAPYEATVEQVRALLGDAGFGVLTEIDLQATLRAKLGVETPPRVILGACRPPLAYAALQADPRIAAMLPCNVVVSATSDTATKVEVFDPEAMVSFSDAEAIAGVAADARQRLSKMLDSLAAAEGVSSATRS
ncbi:MAG: DUF302 domain-containing protein [Nocardioidaceae bacterium]|nr:MAG: DUF302 domain-containing protein [Nocardioidaceae bacterium]